ncbi:hypothetical protein [Corynebacterium sp.]|uniref:VG15 protein n=1 Tax=Corynebacterium sp. TaxID=1720 RepID=UPI0028B1A69B|nr:hypothetical protein [Corynebacterium sp.]
MDIAWREYDIQLQAAVRTATQQLMSIVGTGQIASADDLLIIYQALIDRYGAATAESALLALENSRRTVNLWDELPKPAAAALPATGQIEGTFSWAVSQSVDKESFPLIAAKLAGPLGRLIQQPARETVYNATADAGTRYARVPGPKACWFCLMLASRGAAYTSKDAALNVTKRSAGKTQTRYRNADAASGHSYRKGRPLGARFHDNCTCIAIESHTPSDLPNVIHQLEKEWIENTHDPTNPNASQIGLWRQHIAATRPNGETLPQALA